MAETVKKPQPIGKPKSVWTVAGVTDKEGKPLEFQNAADAAANSKESPIWPPRLGFPGGTGSTPAPTTELSKQLYDDGSVVVSRFNPDSKKWEIFDVETNQGVAKQAEWARQEANRIRDDEKAALPKTAMPQTPEEKKHTEALTKEVEARTVGLNPQIEVPSGPTQDIPIDQGGGTSQPTRTISKAQSDASAKLVDQAQEQERIIISRGNAAVAAGTATATQAHNTVTEQLDKLRLSLEQQAHELTARGQDATAATTQRGQDMSRETSLAGTTAHLHEALLPYLAPPWQLDQVDHLVRGGSPETMPARRPTQNPYDPSTVVSDAVTAARGSAPPQYQLPAVSPLRPVDPLQLPAATR